MGASTLRASSIIKSVQRGSLSLGPGATASITVTAVDTAKSVLIMSCANGYASSTNLSGGAAAVLIGGKITNSTTLDFTCGNASSNYTAQTGNATAYWELVEYE